MNPHKHPEIYHGKASNKNYFEGWYYKQVTADGKHTISFIPGVSFSATESRSFIQCIYRDHNNQMHTCMVNYSIEAFNSQAQPFKVQVGDSQFSKEGLEIALSSPRLNVRGQLKFTGLTALPYRFLQPNIMGVFSYIPNMECNHGVISLNHTLTGRLTINDRTIDFSDGKGYIEKDWGRSFPSRYMWIQSNHFDNPTISLFFSKATIPFKIMSFDGFICHLLIDDQHYRFATYTGAKLKIDSKTEQSVKMTLKDRRYRLTIEAAMQDQQPLRAPKHGAMTHVIKEALRASVKFSLTDIHTGHQAVHSSNVCGMEIVESLKQDSN